MAESKDDLDGALTSAFKSATQEQNKSASGTLTSVNVKDLFKD